MKKLKLKTVREEDSPLAYKILSSFDDCLRIGNEISDPSFFPIQCFCKSFVPFGQFTISRSFNKGNE